MALLYVNVGGFGVGDSLGLGGDGKQEEEDDCAVHAWDGSDRWGGVRSRLEGWLVWTCG